MSAKIVVEVTNDDEYDDNNTTIEEYIQSKRKGPFLKINKI